MTQTNLTSRLLSMFILLASIFVTIGAHAERLLYTSTLMTQYEALAKDLTTREAQLSERLANQSDLDSSLTLLLMAKHHYDNRQYTTALTRTNLALAALDKENQQDTVANALFMRAMITSIGLTKYSNSAQLFEAVLAYISDDSEPELQRLRAQTFRRLGSLQLFLKRPKHANVYISKAINAAKELQATDIEIDARLDLAKYYLAQQDNESAESELLLAHKLSIATDNLYLQKVLIQISRFYRKSERYPLAIKYGKSALKLTQESQTEKLIAWTHNNLAIAYHESNDLNMALVHYINALHHAKEHTSVFYALAQHNIGSIYLEQQKLTKSKTYLTGANTMFRTIEHPYYLMQNNLSVGKVLIALANYPLAIDHLNQSISSARENDSQQVIEEAQEQLIIAHTQLKNFETANQLHQTLTQALQKKLKHLVDKQKKTKKAANKHHQLEKIALDSEVQITLLNQTNKDSTQRITLLSYALLFITISFSIALILSWRLVSRKSRTNTLLNTSSVMGISQLHTGEMLVSSLNSYYHNDQLLITIRIPLLANLNHYFNQEQAHQIYHQWIECLSKNMTGKLFCLNDSILVIAASQNEGMSLNALFGSITNTVLHTTPVACQRLMKTEYGIYMGASTLAPFRAQPNDSEASNTLNLALLMLAGVESEDLPPSQHRWLLAKPKTQSQNSIFNFCSRSEWVYSIKNNLIVIDSDRHHKIDWDKIVSPRGVE